MRVNQENLFFATIERNIRQLAKKQKITLSDLSSAIGMTEAGFYKMLSTESIKVKTLKKIAEVLNYPIKNFFEDSENIVNNDQHPQLLVAAEPAGVYMTEKEALKKHIVLLESQIADKNKIIELLSKK